MKVRRAISVIGFLLVIGMALAQQGTLVVSQWSAPSGFRVLTAADQYAYQDIALMFASLAKLDDDLQPVPELAQKWDISEDGLNYTFYLDPKAKWHDGKPVTAKDVAFTFQLAADPKIPASSYSRFNSIKGYEEYHQGKAKSIPGIKIINDRTIQIILSRPDAAFLSNISKSHQMTNEILPEHLLGNLEPGEVENSPFWQRPVGAGPFKFVDYKNGQYLELEAFNDYVLGAPKIKKLFVRIGSQDVLLAQLQRGEVDFAQIPPAEFDRIKTLTNIATSEVPSVNFQAIYIQHTKPYLQDVRIRKALAYALDRDAMVKALLLGHGETVTTPIAAPKWAVSTDVTRYPYDPAKARQLLKEAGWDANRTLVIRLGAGNKVREQSAPIIQQYLKAVGINSRIEMTDFATLVKDMQAANFDLALVGHGSGFDPDYTAIWSATESQPPYGNNFGRYSNPTIDKLLKDGREAVGSAKRKPIYERYQKLLVDDLPMIWMYRATDLYGLNKRVSGAKFGPGADPFWNIAEWTVR